jgi:hypothetical protein
VFVGFLIKTTPTTMKPLFNESGHLLSILIEATIYYDHYLQLKDPDLLYLVGDMLKMKTPNLLIIETDRNKTYLDTTSKVWLQVPVSVREDGLTAWFSVGYTINTSDTTKSIMSQNETLNFMAAFSRTIISLHHNFFTEFK